MHNLETIANTAILEGLTENYETLKMLKKLIKELHQLPEKHLTRPTTGEQQAFNNGFKWAIKIITGGNQ